MTRSVLITPHPAPLTGRASPPGSKSITNRALLLAALAAGSGEESLLTGALKSEDTERMAQALRAMGAEISEPDETSFTVRGAAPLRAPGGPLFLGNAGTAMRFLTATAALADGQVILDGDAPMRRRPIAPLVAALRTLGIEASAPTGTPPVFVQGTGRVGGGRVEIDAGLSSQYVSALLMLAPCAAAPLEVALRGSAIGARGYVDLTLAVMRRFGARVLETAEGAWQASPGGYRPANLLIEPDASAATYLWAAETLTGGKIDLGVEASDFTQPDAAAHRLIGAFPHMPAVIDGSQIQDAVPTLAVMASFNAGPVRFTGIANLRVKECDRITALRSELNRIRPGLAAEEGDDLIVYGDPSLAGSRRPTQIETYEDHRIAMSFALAGLLIDGIEILDPQCVAKTWPRYWDTLRGLGVKVR